jgi:fibrillarin-like pre-rRNA processing protein
MPPREILPGIYLLVVEGKQRLATKPLVPRPVYGERIWQGYRLWNPHRSKLAAWLLKGGLPEMDLAPSAKMLYLGAATGTTVSHCSDILRDGLVYAVEFSARSIAELLLLCEARKNIIPILADASFPEGYCMLLEPVEIVYQDVAQRNQAEIAALNCERYLKPGGTLLLMIKARSIDVRAPPEELVSREVERLQGLEILAIRDLRPYYLDHWAVVARKVSR